MTLHVGFRKVLLRVSLLRGTFFNMRLLFTSASEPAALALARVLAAEGHSIYAADEERTRGTAPARYSSAYTSFYRTTPNSGLVELWKVLRDDTDLIIPFHELSHHVRRRLEQQGANVMGRNLFGDNHEYQDFVREYVANISGQSSSIIKAPAAFHVYSRTCIVEILGQYPTTTFSLQPAPYCDLDDEDTLVDVESPAISTSSTSFPEEEPLMLSCAALDDDMVEAMKALSISEERPYRMVEVAEEGTLFSAHAFVSSNRVRTFVVTTNREMQKDYNLVPSTQPLFKIIYQFTTQLVDALGNWQHGGKALTTHLSLTFRVKEEVRSGVFVRKTTAVSCSTQPHSSLALLCSLPSIRRQLAHAYTKRSKSVGHTGPLTLPATRMPWGLYSIPSIIQDVIRVLRLFAPFRYGWWIGLSRSIIMCWVKIACFQEEMWRWKDPGPAICLWITKFVDFIRYSGYVRAIRCILRTQGERWEDQTDGSSLYRAMRGTFSIARAFWSCWMRVWTCD
jgi:hypothetical protein